MERVWDYPRPPSVVACRLPVRVELAGELLADSSSALRVLETSHPPTVYVPAADVLFELVPSVAASPTWCEFKGHAQYVDALLGGRRFEAVGWTYPKPSAGYEQLRDHIAFYPSRVDAAWIGEERVTSQEGDFYGGWITSDLVGPFKGAPGTSGW